MDQILELLWKSSTWGKVAVAMVAVFAIIATIWALRREARGQRLRKDLLKLARQWPFLSPRAIESRARAFTEAFFTGWNARDLSGIEPYCDPSIAQDLHQCLAESVAKGSYQPFKVEGLAIPVWSWARLPDGVRPARVVLRMALLVPKVSNSGYGERPFVLSLDYGLDGTWRVQEFVFGEFQEVDYPPVDLNPAGLAEANVAEPSGETLHPVRPPAPASARPKRSGEMIFAILVLCGFVGVLSWILGREIFRAQDCEALKRTGSRAIATILGQEVDDQTYRFDYVFRPQPTAPALSNRGTVPLVIGEEALRTRSLEVVFDPAQPERNCPLHQVDMPASMLWLLLVPAAGVGLVIFLLKLEMRSWKRNASVYWMSWEDKARDHRRPLVVTRDTHPRPLPVAVRRATAPESPRPGGVGLEQALKEQRDQTRAKGGCCLALALVTGAMGTAMLVVPGSASDMEPREALTVLRVSGAVPEVPSKNGKCRVFVLPDGAEVRLYDHLIGHLDRIALSFTDSRTVKELRLRPTPKDKTAYGDMMEVKEIHPDGTERMVCSYEDTMVRRQRNENIGHLLGWTFLGMTGIVVVMGLRAFLQSPR